MTVFTVGHSTRTLAELLALLAEQEVELLADVRSYPSSRKFPHFNQGSLQAALWRVRIGYCHLKALGGLRRSGLDPSPNLGWKSPGFRHYADHMLSREFRQGIRFLLEKAQRQRTALLCAEANPYRCHRRLISDYLLAIQGVSVRHLLAPGRWEEHRLTPFARVEEGKLLYPPPQLELYG